MNTLLVGIETQVLSILSQQRSGSDQLLGVLSVANYVLTFMFAVEVVMRVLVLGLHNPKDRMWNVFDMIILVLALVEIALDIAVQILSGRGRNPFDHGGMAKMLRLFRLTRLLRIVRTVRQLKPLRVLVHSIASASKSVFWALMLLVMIVYAFGVILTQAATEHTEGGARVDDEDLVSYYGDLYLSMLSLWMAVSGGINWNQLTAPLEGTGNATWMMFFLVYITFVYFFVLNVVTGVFCQNAIEGAQQDLDLTIEAQLKEKQVYAERLRMLFDEMNEDYDADEELTAAVIQEQMAKPKVQSWFNALGTVADRHKADLEALQGHRRLLLRRGAYHNLLLAVLFRHAVPFIHAHIFQHLFTSSVSSSLLPLPTVLLAPLEGVDPLRKGDPSRFS
ncbi:unnamed protein product [Prorocentrum cordatum]|uniref:Ion transport domain-containing protein n=1 Tax=Prorocentrum cordatum TaxID=2364126 RepID=A0ABN9WRH8_9DINO|nr:unnamed protein product [Polarella glacialis]